MLKAVDIMSEEVIVIYEDMLIRQVAHLMLRDRVSSFPVVEKGIGIVGMISMTDLFLMLNKACKNETREPLHKQIDCLKNLQVTKVMSKDVVSISPQATVDEIVHLVVEKGVHSFPVLDNGKLVGIVGRHDILNAIFSYD